MFHKQFNFDFHIPIWKKIINFTAIFQGFVCFFLYIGNFLFLLFMKKYHLADFLSFKTHFKNNGLLLSPLTKILRKNT